MSVRSHSDLAILTRLLRQARPQWPQLVAIFLLNTLAAPLALLVPVPLMVAVDSVISDEPLPAFLAWALPADIVGSAGPMLAIVASLVVGIALLTQLRNMATWLLQTYTGERLALNFRSRLLRHAQRLSLAYHDSKGTADAIYRVQYDAPAIQWVVVYGITPFITAGLTLIGMVAVTASIDWQLALVALAVSPVIIFLTQHFRGRLRSQWRDVKKLETSALSIVHEVLSALRVVKVFGQEEREHNRFVRCSDEGLWARLRVVVSDSAFGLLVGMTIAAGTATVLYLGVNNVRAEVLTLGQLLLVMSYLAQLYQPLQAIGQQVTKLQNGLTGAERAFALLDELPDVVDRPDGRELARARGDIAFERVAFSYDGEHRVIDDVSFAIPAGSRVGIIGRTGAGKTTLINLILRLYDPTHGSIALDGVDIRDYRLAALRDQFAMVLQEPVLLSTSIAENIAYGRPEADRDAIVAAAQAANADEFIRTLPDGYETQVGERGMRLSGGQRQRIAIARAFLKDAPILILDEPTSSVDTKTESVIIDAMDRLMENRTTLMIAHRLSTLRDCDMLLELDGGRLVSATRQVADVIEAAG
ncbi:MAG: ABC transporter ATP-binding protein [Chromatiaceae bacterium]|jgi:ATP-binding cassette subfamily B protein